MHRLSSTLFGLAAMFGAATSAFAGAGDIVTTVTPLQTNVTYSTTTPAVLETYVGYRVAIENRGANTVNHIRFTASASVTDPLELATYDSVEGATCKTTNAALTAIECWIGQLPAGVSYPTFAVFFKAPAKIVNSVADGDLLTGLDYVNLSGDMVYAEGPNGGNPAPNSVVSWAPLGPVQVTLGTASDTDVRSGVPKAGGTFFTGDGAVTRGVDKFSTLLIVPAATAYTTAEIKESPFTDGCTNFTTCYQSNITAPGTFSPYLTVVLRQDASNIRPGTKIASVLIKYVDSLTLVESIVGECGTGPVANPLGVPCIAKSVYYKNRSVSDWTPDLDGDFEWTLISLKNGKLAIY